MKLEELDSQLEKNQLSGFWRTRVPGHASEAPYLWKWEPLLDGLLKASETIGIEQAERRAIRLVSPHLPMKSTSHTLQITFSIVNPGEVAKAHRHNMAAIRFVVQGKGAYTAVDGEKFFMEEGDLILFAADQWLTACEILGRIRLYCAEVLKGQGTLTLSRDEFCFLWVVDFPLLSFDKEQNRWYSSHHPFTAPVSEDIALLASDPKKVRGQHYDVVVNGVELGGGSIRVHQPDVQRKIFEDILQIPPETVKARFGYMLEAFRYGCPPHGGIALGFDRLIAILCRTTSIRDVIAFPKTAKGTDLMTNSPAPVEPNQLRDLHIELKAAQKE